MSLTPKQDAFVREYLVDLNAAQAAIRAGYSAKTAKEIGAENLTKPHVSAAITAALEARKKRTEVSADMVVQGLLTEATREGEGSSHGARVSAWGLLARHLGLLKDRVEISGPPFKIYLGFDPEQV